MKKIIFSFIALSITIFVSAQPFTPVHTGLMTGFTSWTYTNCNQITSEPGIGDCVALYSGGAGYITTPVMNFSTCTGTPYVTFKFRRQGINNERARIGIEVSANGIAGPFVPHSSVVPSGDGWFSLIPVDLSTYSGYNNIALRFRADNTPNASRHPVIDDIHIYCAIPPANDNCAGAIPLTVGGPGICTPTSGTVNYATESLPTSGCVGTSNNDVWYRFVATNTQQIIRVSGSAGMDAVIELLSGTCGSLTSLQCKDASLSGGTESINYTGLTVGNTYYVRVYDWYSSPPINGNFNICVYESAGNAGNYLHPTVGKQGTYNGACMVNTCSGTYTDDGDVDGNYSNNVNSIYRTFCPDEAGKCMTATITSFFISGSAGCIEDALIIRDGPTQGSPFIWGACGDWSSSLPLSFTASNSSGCLTFVFESNASATAPGWEIELNCTDCTQAQQTNNDCNTATAICGATNLNSASPGPGLTSTCGGCNLSENYSNWYYFEITGDGKLALDIKSEDFFEDYDFALYQGSNCASLPAIPIRCSYAQAPSYCRPYYSGSFTSGIYDLTFNTISNYSGGVTSGHYATYTNQSTTVNVGSSYTLTVEVGGSSPVYVTAWFDWNKNLVFDAGERVDIGITTGGSDIVSKSIPIPTTARGGKTGFRVYTNRSSYQTNPCAASPSGEAETYAIFINDGTHCSNNIKDADEEGVDCGGADCVDCTFNNWSTNTGMNSTAGDNSEDVYGDSWVDVTAGQRYYLMVNNWSPGAQGFDLLWNFTGGGAMDCEIVPTPVELLSFDASCNDGTIDIIWEVASEINNDYFVVLKSYNGIAFSSVDTIKGRGTANSYKEYSISYTDAYDGTIYYKLKQIDYDGVFEYSNMTATSCGLDTRTFTVTPNPIFQGEDWKVTGLLEGDKVRVVDIHGREHDKANLKSGAYIVLVNEKPVSKIVVQ